MHPRTRRLTGAIAGALAAGALVAGCGDDDDDAATTPAAAAPTPTTFAITATAEGKTSKALEFPDSVKAGLVQMRLTNNDTVPRSVQIFRVVGDRTVDDVLKIVNTENAKIPEWIQDGGGIAAVDPDDMGSAMQVLAPGKYVIWDDEGGGDEEDAPGHAELGAKGEFTVTGPAPVDIELPEQPAKVSASDVGEGDDKEYRFEFEGLKAGTNQVRFENTGEELHHALFFPMRQGATIEDVKTAFESEGEPEGPPPVDLSKAVGTSVIDGDVAQNIELELDSERYAVVCFTTDRDGGKPHVAKGMIEELTIE